MRSSDGDGSATFFQLVKEKIWRPICLQSLYLQEQCTNLIIGLLYENGKPSLTRAISIVGYLAFLVASGYLIITGRQWEHYETFAALTGGGGAATQIANKVINSVYNSPKGVFPDRTGEENNGEVKKMNTDNL